ITAAPEDVAWSIAVVQFADGQAAPALATLAELFGWLPDRLLLLSNDPGAGAELVRIALAAADTTRARSAAEAAGVLAGRNPAAAAGTRRADRYPPGTGRRRRWWFGAVRADRGGAHHRAARRGGHDQPADRHPDRPLAAHRGQPPAQHLPEARRQQPGGGRPCH